MQEHELQHNWCGFHIQRLEALWSDPAAERDGHGNRFFGRKHALESYTAEFFSGITLMNSLLLAPSYVIHLPSSLLHLRKLILFQEFESAPTWSDEDRSKRIISNVVFCITTPDCVPRNREFKAGAHALQSRPTVPRHVRMAK